MNNTLFWYKGKNNWLSISFTSECRLEKVYEAMLRPGDWLTFSLNIWVITVHLVKILQLWTPVPCAIFMVPPTWFWITKAKELTTLTSWLFSITIFLSQWAKQSILSQEMSHQLWKHQLGFYNKVKIQGHATLRSCVHVSRTTIISTICANISRMIFPAAESILQPLLYWQSKCG